MIGFMMCAANKMRGTLHPWDIISITIIHNFIIKLGYLLQFFSDSFYHIIILSFPLFKVSV